MPKIIPEQTRFFTIGDLKAANPTHTPDSQEYAAINTNLEVFIPKSTFGLRNAPT